VQGQDGKNPDILSAIPSISYLNKKAYLCPLKPTQLNQVYYDSQGYEDRLHKKMEESNRWKSKS